MSNKKASQPSKLSRPSKLHRKKLPNLASRFINLSIRLKLMVFVIIFAVIGCLTIVFSQAATHNIPANIASNCSADVTGSLSAWIASVPNDSVISFAANGCYRIDGTIELRDRKGLTFEGNGSTFRTDVQASGQRAHWRFIYGTQITMRNLTILGANVAGGTSSAYHESLQWQHAIDLRGVSGFTIDKVTSNNAYGDCFYVGLGYNNTTWSTGVTIQNSTCTKNGRMGTAITAGQNVLIQNNLFDLVGLTSVAVEPNGGVTGGRDITVSGNTIGKSRHWTFAAIGYSGGGYIDNITVSNNSVKDRSMTMKIDWVQGRRPSNIRITNNTGAVKEWYNPSQAVIDIFEADNVQVSGNSQVAAGTGQVFVYARNSCASVSGNNYSGGPEFRNESPSCATPPPVTYAPEDLNNDGKVNILDFSILSSKFGQTGSNLGKSDINQDGKVNILDFSLLAAKLGA